MKRQTDDQSCCSNATGVSFYSTVFIKVSLFQSNFSRKGYRAYRPWLEKGVSVKTLKNRKDSSHEEVKEWACANCRIMPRCLPDNPDAWKISSNNGHFFSGSSSKI